MGTQRLTDQQVEQVITGVLPELRDDLRDLATTVRALRESVPGHPPTPSSELAALLALGRSGNVAPAPSTRRSRGPVRRAVAVLAGLGLGTQVAVGAAAAVGTLGAAGLAGVLPDGAQQLFDDAVGRQDDGGAVHPKPTVVQLRRTPDREREPGLTDAPAPEHDPADGRVTAPEEGPGNRSADETRPGAHPAPTEVFGPTAGPTAGPSAGPTAGPSAGRAPHDPPAETGQGSGTVTRPGPADGEPKDEPTRSALSAAPPTRSALTGQDRREPPPEKENDAPDVPEQDGGDRQGADESDGAPGGAENEHGPGTADLPARNDPESGGDED